MKEEEEEGKKKTACYLIFKRPVLSSEEEEKSHRGPWIFGVVVVCRRQSSVTKNLRINEVVFGQKRAPQPKKSNKSSGGLLGFYCDTDGTKGVPWRTDKALFLEDGLLFLSSSFPMVV